jgi:hypothetical protein
MAGASKRLCSSRVRSGGLVVMLLLPALAGCGGLTVPEMREPFESKQAHALNKNDLVNQVKCELQKAYFFTLSEASQSDDERSRNVRRWLSKLVAKVSLKLSVLEKSALSPTASLVDPLERAKRVFPNRQKRESLFVDQLFTLGLGANYANDATRTETLGFFYALAEFEPPRAADRPCGTAPVHIRSELKVAEFVRDSVFLAQVPETFANKSSKTPFETFDYQVTFVVTYGGYANPAWTLHNASINGNQPLLAASRQRTHTLTITLGPADDPAARQALENQHLASLIGKEVATALRSQPADD